MKNQIVNNEKFDIKGAMAFLNGETIESFEFLEEGLKEVRNVLNHFQHMEKELNERFNSILQNIIQCFKDSYRGYDCFTNTYKEPSSFLNSTDYKKVTNVCLDFQTDHQIFCDNLPKYDYEYRFLKCAELLKQIIDIKINFFQDLNKIEDKNTDKSGEKQ